MSEGKDPNLQVHGIHGTPGDEVAAAKEALPAAAAIVMESESSTKDGKEDYDSQPEDKAGIGNFWVSNGKPAWEHDMLTN